MKTNYNSLIYLDKVDTVYDVAKGKGKDIHNQLLRLAIDNFTNQFCSKYDITKEEFSSLFVIIETPNNQYDKPSSIVLRKVAVKDERLKDIPRNQVISLRPYWPEYVYRSTYNDIIAYDENISYTQDEIISIDYVKGTAIAYNRGLDIKYTIPISSLNKYTTISTEMTLTNRFSD